MTNYKLIVLDVDGTLAKRKNVVSNKNIQAIREANAQGIKVLLASGRSVRNLAVIYDQLQLTQETIWGIAYNGAVIYDFKNQQTVSELMFSASEVEQIFHLANDEHLIIWGYDAKNSSQGYIGRRRSLFYRFLELHNKRKGVVYDSKQPAFAHKIIVGGNRVAVNKFRKVLQSQLECNIFDFSYFSSKRAFIEISPLHADKLDGLQKVCADWNINQEAVVAFGDGSNDVEMLKWAGLGVAMQNAKQHVKRSANIVGPSNKKDGIAHILHERILANDK